MHYFWRGDMQHFSPLLPFQQGREECRRVLARDLGGPNRGRLRVPGCGSPLTPSAGSSSTSAGQSGAPARAGVRWSVTPADARRRPRRARAGRPHMPGPRPLRRARRRPRLARHHCRRGPARRSPRGPSAAGRDRHNLKLARRTGRGPAEASAGPCRRRPCPIFTLLLILLTTPS